MAGRSSIEWTEYTWNPVTGCSKVSAGCRNCYAERIARRLQAMGQANYARGFRVTLHEAALGTPLRWTRPSTVFVNSMSDLFHEEVPNSFVREVFTTMRRAPQHHFQILTKRAERLREIAPFLHWPANVWMGVSVEDSDYRYRIDCLRTTAACVKFVSIEPLLGPVADLDLTGIDWVIVGGESGPGARPMKRGWVVDIRDQCLCAGVPFFFKQWGGTRKAQAGRSLDGRTWDQMPAELSRVRVPTRTGSVC